MLGRRLTAVVAALALALGANTAQAGGALYRLNEGSNLSEGCLAPCLCPIFLAGDVQGTFLLNLTLASQFTQVYSIENLHWTVVAFDGSRQTVKGEGTYTRSNPFIASPTQQLELELSIDGAPAVKFDSGVVLDNFTFPTIDLSIADNDFFCYNRVFAVDVSPPPASDILTFELKDTTLQEGCYPPCKCPLQQPRRIKGTFDLVFLGTDGFLTEYSVADVRWRTGMTSLTGSRTRIGGTGTYTVLEGLGPLPVEQMDLCLTFNGVETEPFSSGPVAGPVTDGIQLVLSQNGMVCFDRVIDLTAEEQ